MQVLYGMFNVLHAFALGLEIKCIEYKVNWV